MRPDAAMAALRRRLTLLFALLTAAVLAALALTCRMAQNEAAAGADLVYAGIVSAVEDAVTANGLLRDSWLAGQESAGRVVIYIEDNGLPLAFPGGWTPADGRDRLAALAKAQAAAAGLHADRAAQFLHSAAAETDRLARLTDDLLILAGGDAGVLQTELARLDADTFLIELYDRYAPVARAQGHTLTLRLPDAPLPALRADAARLEQLFAVLLHNAFEYAPAGTPVEITAALPPRGGLCVAVADHGPGVPDTDKARIFDRFARGDPNRTDKAHFGLGLAVAAEIAALHGATLRVTDTPGGGATFAVCWGRGAAERGGKTVV